MLPPDFTKLTDRENYFFPEELSLPELLLPLPLNKDEARARQRWVEQHFSSNGARCDAGDRADGSGGDVPGAAGCISFGLFSGPQPDPASLRLLHRAQRPQSDSHHS
jgi:hypothetical protein